jgi:hypothetical protein
LPARRAALAMNGEGSGNIQLMLAGDVMALS